MNLAFILEAFWGVVNPAYHLGSLVISLNTSIAVMGSNIHTNVKYTITCNELFKIFIPLTYFYTQ